MENKLRDVFIRAAEIVDRDEEEFSCVAVQDAARKYGYSHMERAVLADEYHNTMMSRGEVYDYLWPMSNTSRSEARNLRVMLLLMMAAVVGYK